MRREDIRRSREEDDGRRRRVRLCRRRARELMQWMASAAAALLCIEKSLQEYEWKRVALCVYIWGEEYSGRETRRTGQHRMLRRHGTVASGDISLNISPRGAVIARAIHAPTSQYISPPRDRISSLSLARASVCKIYYISMRYIVVVRCTYIIYDVSFTRIVLGNKRISCLKIFIFCLYMIYYWFYILNHRYIAI